MRKTHTTLLVALLLLALSNADASVLDKQELDIPTLYKQVGISNKVPYKILYAIALAESGFISPTNKQYRPWPWTLNVNGSPERHMTKKAAFESLKNHLNSGMKNIDIGIAQINYKWNGELLPSLPEALDPEINLTVAAEILARELRKCEVPNWWCAVGRYHSPGKSVKQQERATSYTARVRAYWEQLA